MTQPTKNRYFRDQALSPDGIYGVRGAVHSPGPACELQSVETPEPFVENETDALPPADLLLERPMKWIAERCPFGERRLYGKNTRRRSDGEIDSQDCLH